MAEYVESNIGGSLEFIASVTPAVSPEVERALRALDARCAEAESHLLVAADEARAMDIYREEIRRSAKANGVSLARSYIADALRGVL